MHRVYVAYIASPPSPASFLLTPIGSPIGADVSELDDMFSLQPLGKGRKSGGLDLSKREQQCLHPRGSNGKQRVQAHSSIWSRSASSSGPPLSEMPRVGRNAGRVGFAVKRRCAYSGRALGVDCGRDLAEVDMKLLDPLSLMRYVGLCVSTDSNSLSHRPTRDLHWGQLVELYRGR